MFKSALAALAVIALMTSPSMARSVPFCDADFGGLIQFGVGTGPGSIYTETELNALYLQRLRANGVDATNVDMWNGCVRAFVNLPGGGSHFEFFEPSTLERIYLN